MKLKKKHLRKALGLKESEIITHVEPIKVRVHIKNANEMSGGFSRYAKTIEVEG